jgi:hypothetical protein
MSYVLPAGKCNATGITASTIFFKQGWPVEGKVFEISTYLPPPCGPAVSGHMHTCGLDAAAKPVVCNLPNHTCGVNKTKPAAPTAAEITTAVQATITAAAAAGKVAVAYFPKGSYPLTATIKVTGKDFYISGCGYQTQMTGGGACTNSTDCISPLFDVAAGSQVAFNFMQIFPSNQTAELVRIQVNGGGHTNVTVNGVQMQGYNEGKRSWGSGIRVDGFVPGVSQVSLKFLRSSCN